MSAVTLRDVALRAGVSAKTVSNVVHNVDSRVSADTARRVRRVIAELGYRPNLSARSLRTGRGHVLALVVPDLRNPYFGELAAPTIRAARDCGYNVFIEETGDSAEAELNAARGLDDPTIEGVIFAPSLLDQSELRRTRVPVVLLGEREPGVPCDRVGFDDREAARQLTAHLLERGYRHIAVVGHHRQLSNATTLRRMEGFRQAHAERGLRAASRLVPTVAPVRYSRHLGHEATLTLLSAKPRPDALFCLADVLAFGAIAAAAERGVRVPDELGIVGFDGLEEAMHRVPTLTTVLPDLEQMASEAVHAVIARIQSPAPLASRYVNCRFQILLGQSTARTMERSSAVQ